MNSGSNTPARHCWCCVALFVLLAASVIYIMVLMVDASSRNNIRMAQNLSSSSGTSLVTATNNLRSTSSEIALAAESWRDSMRKRFLYALRKVSEALRVLKQEPHPTSHSPGGE